MHTEGCVGARDAEGLASEDDGYCRRERLRSA
jgi:hypothetical protein